MTTFDCPRCGAPLSFQPNPGDETVECSFCHETVIIPKELRIPKPRVVVDHRPPPPRTGQKSGLIVAFIIMGVIAACVIISILADSSKQSTASDVLPADTPVIDSGSPTVDAGATVEAKATADALQPILKVEQSWPASFTEKFKDNSQDWKTGDVRDSYISGNRSISDGIYTWNITAVKSASDFSLPNMPDQTDFLASVDIQYNNMPDDPDADAGMVFRYNSTDQTWYYYSVNDKGQYYFGRYDGNDWYSLIPETDSTVYKPGQTNRLSVGVKGSQFIFLINGQMVDHFINDNLKSGTIGLGVNLPQTGEKASVEFSNFTVFSSPSKP